MNDDNGFDTDLDEDEQTGRDCWVIFLFSREYRKIFHLSIGKAFSPVVVWWSDVFIFTRRILLERSESEKNESLIGVDKTFSIHRDVLIIIRYYNRVIHLRKISCENSSNRMRRVFL